MIQFKLEKKSATFSSVNSSDFFEHPMGNGKSGVMISLISSRCIQIV